MSGTCNLATDFHQIILHTIALKHAPHFITGKPLGNGVEIKCSATVILSHHSSHKIGFLKSHKLADTVDSDTVGIHPGL